MVKRSGFKVMLDLLKLVESLTGLMILAIFFGVMGHISAILIPVLGVSLVFFKNQYVWILPLLIGVSIGRGFFRYLEQGLNHELAFRVLASLRDTMFGKMRQLAPSKLETKDRGHLISLITSDIEQLEVFYAHTISPFFIALIVNALVAIAMFKISLMFGMISVTSYVLIGLVFPFVFGRKGRSEGQNYRNNFANVNSFVLESVGGVQDILQFGQETKKIEELKQFSHKLNKSQHNMNALGIQNDQLTEFIVLFSMVLFLVANARLQLPLSSFLLALTLHSSSFGPVIALSNLANNLYHTLASGDRVLDILAENPTVTALKGNDTIHYENISLDHVAFKYGDHNVLEDVNIQVGKNEIVGLQGPSGCGKSTILKLMMRYWDVERGELKISHRNIKKINTTNLIEIEGYMGQSTDLYQMSIRDNIRIGKWDSSLEDVQSSAKKSGIHNFIMSLDKGYETSVKEFGSSLSSGEKQRIALARLFLKDADLMLLDEPTSNLDSLNEAIVLKSLLDNRNDRAIIITSHRLSTLNIVNRKYVFKGKALVED